MAGTFQCGGLHLAEDDEAREFYKAVGGKYLELHGHFPYYGQYWNEGEWPSIGEYERRRLAAQKTGGAPDHNTAANPPVHSQRRMLDGIKKLQAEFDFSTREVKRSEAPRHLIVGEADSE